MSIKLGVVMDPIASIHPEKDSTFAMLQAAQRRGWCIYYFELADLFVQDGVAYGCARPLSIEGTQLPLGSPDTMKLGELDVMLMRKDPPFDMNYVYATYMLELAERDGCWVVNKPQSLRDANEKLFTSYFPQCCPDTLVSQDPAKLRKFWQVQGDIIVKPLDGMGGHNIFRIQKESPNVSVILENLTNKSQTFIMAQRYIPEITQGDKRILLIDGEPVPYALARIPAPGETRGNLAAGGDFEGRELTVRDRWICQQVGPVLREKGLLFVGLDIIGDYLTEINVTSPTCIRQLDALYGLDIASQLLDVIQSRL